MNNLFISDVSNLIRSSRQKVQIKCSYQISEKCEKIITLQYWNAIRNIEKNEKYLCIKCANFKMRGNEHPLKKYFFNDNMFKQLNHEKAYLLGWIASDGTISDDKIRIVIHEKDVECLKILANIISKDYDIKYWNDNMIILRICSKTISRDVCNLLQINPGKKFNIVKFPEIEDELKWDFLRGYFEGDGTIQDIEKCVCPRCSITSNSIGMLNGIKEFTKIPCNMGKNSIEFSGLNSLDFLNKIYENCGIYKLQRKFDMYCRWIESGWQPRIGGKGNSGRLKNCFAYKTNINAIIPHKICNLNVNDCFSILIIKEHRIINNKTILYDTGIKFSIPRGYFIEVFALPLLEEMEYILPNNVIIVNSSYIGNLYIPLTKISPDAQEIKLPLLCCQMTIKQGRIY